MGIRANQLFKLGTTDDNHRNKCLEDAYTYPKGTSRVTVVVVAFVLVAVTMVAFVDLSPAWLVMTVRGVTYLMGEVLADGQCMGNLVGGGTYLVFQSLPLRNVGGRPQAAGLTGVSEWAGNKESTHLCPFAMGYQGLPMASSVFMFPGWVASIGRASSPGVRGGGK
jgi:hypothetical protein